MNSRFLSALLLSFLIFPIQAKAEYYVNSNIMAEDCSGFGIKVCSSMRVTEYRDGKSRFPMPTVFSNVTRFNASSGMCYFKWRSSTDNPIGWALNKASGKELWGFDSKGRYAKIDADEIYFRCVRG